MRDVVFVAIVDRVLRVAAAYVRAVRAHHRSDELIDVRTRDAAAMDGPEPTRATPMTADNVVGLVISVLIAAYLVVALALPGEALT